MKFLTPRDVQGGKRSKTVVDWMVLLSVSGLFVVCILAVLTIPGDVDRFGWSCERKWRSFSGLVVRLAPWFLLLAAAGRKGTRILSILWVLAVHFDCLMIDGLP
jgi:hypothetical protein